jgi:HSP20 family protein
MRKNQVALTRASQQALMKQEEAAMVKPFADVYETDEAYVVKLDLPGAEKDKINVSIRPGFLSVRAVVQPSVREEHKVLFREIQANKVYYREFRLAEGADHNRVEAQFDDGVLTVTIGKTDLAKAKYIPIH